MDDLTRLVSVHPVVDEVLAAWRDALGRDAVAYRGHVYRVLHFAAALAPPPASPARDDTLAAVAVFHDLGIWSDRTFDYLEPSVARARAFVSARLPMVDAEEVARMILLHHKVTACDPAAGALAEAFRRADLVDLSLGTLRFGLPAGDVRAVRQAFPNAGFHRCLLRMGAGWMARHPARPLPMFRW